MARRANNAANDKAGFLAAFIQTGCITTAASAAGISRQTHYKWLNEDEQYRKDWEQAKIDSCESMEAEARRRAISGVPQYKFHQGEVLRRPDICECGAPVEHHTKTKAGRGGCKRTKCTKFLGAPYIEQSYSDTLLIFLMKGNMPERYGDRRTHVIEGGLNPVDLATKQVVIERSVVQLPTETKRTDEPNSGSDSGNSQTNSNDGD